MLKKKKQLITILSFIVALILVVMIANNIKNKGMEADTFATTREILTDTWGPRYISNTKLTVLSPAGLKQIPIVLDHNAKETLVSYDAYQYTKNTFELRINYIVAKNDLDSKDYATKLAEMIKSSKDVIEYKYTIEPYSKGSLSGSLLRGTATKANVMVNINSVVLVQGTDLCDVTVTYNSTNDRLEKLAEAVVNSVEIR